LFQVLKGPKHNNHHVFAQLATYGSTYSLQLFTFG